MKTKEVEDVLGGADSWKNVDTTEGALEASRLRALMALHIARETDGYAVNCVNDERCDNRRAYFRQVQIRSADEPMTTFYKVMVLI